MCFECKNAHSSPLFFRHEIIKLPDKIITENWSFIRKSINFNLPPISNDWFTFSSDSHNYATSKALQKVC